VNIKTILLGALSSASMTGYELKKIFSLSFSYFSGLSYGSIYPALKKMEAEGLISMRLEIQETAPNRKIYTITPKGQRAFREALRLPFGMERHKNSFLMRLMFFSHLSREERLDAANNYLESIHSSLRELKDIEPEIKARADRFQFLCFQFGLRYVQDLARNVAAVIEALNDNERIG
jgi:DNA-binding PadR family transcriptional regulator